MGAHDSSLLKVVLPQIYDLLSANFYCTLPLYACIIPTLQGIFSLCEHPLCIQRVFDTWDMVIKVPQTYSNLHAHPQTLTRL